MAISFSCPNCKAHVQVGDELAGQTGQCPRCERFIVIPSSATPMPILLDAAGNPVPIFLPTAPRVEPRAKPPRYDEPRRARRRPPIEKKAAGPKWPWALGILAGLAVVGLLFSSFIVLCAYRPHETPANVQIVTKSQPKSNGVRFGRLEGNRAILHDGLFLIRTALTPNDPVHLNARFKQYNVELRANTVYVIEMESEFAGALRLQDRAGHVLVQGDQRIIHMPPFGAAFTVVATSVDPVFGDFTLTIREAKAP